MMKCFLVTILFALGVAQPTFATPPDELSLHDRLLGVSDTHVFILRNIHDNLGDYDFGLQDIYLVAKNLQTGFDDHIWPVSRIKLAYDEASGMEVLQNHPLEDSVNPYEILAQFSALPGIRVMYDLSEQFAPATTYDWNEISIKETPMALGDVFAQMQQSVDITANAIQPYADTISASSALPQESMAKINLNFDSCEIVAASSVKALGQDHSSPVARIYCYDDDFLLTAGLIIVVPLVEN